METGLRIPLGSIPGTYTFFEAEWSSQVARQPHKLKVVGSNPTSRIQFGALV